MNKKVVIGIVVVLVVVLGGAGAYLMKMQADAAKWKEAKEFVKEESTFTKEGVVTTMHFVAIIDGPIDKIAEAMWKIEDSEKVVDTIVMSKLIEEKGNTKTIRMRIKAENLPLQEQVMAFTREPSGYRVSFKSVKSPAQDIEGSYNFEPSPDGKRTRIVYDATAKDKVSVPLPQSVIEGAMRETFVQTVRGLKRSI
jgi:hypothetical protein